MAIAGLMTLAGCEKPEEITSYTVASHESIQTPEFLAETASRKPKPARMLAAIIPRGELFWFVKLQGPPDAVATREGEFREFLKSLRFTEAGAIKWTLPGDWQEKPERANEMRYATLTLPGDPKLEATVTKLPGGSDLTEALLSNINRWRSQLDLPFIEAADLPSRTEAIRSGDLEITFLNIVGKAKPAAAMPSGMPPMAGPHAGPDRPTPAPAAAKDEQASDIKFEKPAAWIQVRPKTFTIAAFEVIDGKKQLSVTISRAGGSKVANVNRWRGQLGIGPLSDEEVAKALQKITVGSRSGELVEMKNDEQTLIAVMIEDGDQTVFVKMMGDSELAAKERQNFDAFAKSLKF